MSHDASSGSPSPGKLLMRAADLVVADGVVVDEGVVEQRFFFAEALMPR